MTESDITAFLVHLEKNRKATASSLKAYQSTLRLFLTFLDGRAADSVLLMEFLRRYENPRSANSRLARIKGLCKYIGIDLGETYQAKVRSEEVRALTSSELSRVLAEVREAAERSAAVFLSETGLRLQEFCDLSLSDVRTSEKGTVYVKVTGKGGKHRSVPLSHRAQKALEALAKKPMDEQCYQIVRLRAALAEAGKKAGVEFPMTPHRLRATFASISLNDKKKDFAKISRILGHSNPATTMLYLRTDIDDLAD